MMILLSSSHLLYFSSPPPIFSLFLPLLPILLSVPPFLSREVLSSRQALNNPLSFIHDVLITNSVINTLPNQCFSSIMPDQSGLMLRRKLDRLLGANSNLSNVREFNRERELRSILGRCRHFLEDSEPAVIICHCHRLIIICPLFMIRNVLYYVRKEDKCQYREKL